MNITTSVWRGYIFIFYQTPKLDAVSGLSSHNIAGDLDPATFGVEALMLNPRILQLGDKSGNIAMYNVLEK